MNLKLFTGPGSTPSRRRFWDKVTQAVIASQKLAGRFVTVDEHLGKGTVINVADTSSRRRRQPSAECPICPSEDSVMLTLSGVSLCTDCIVLGGTAEGLSIVIDSADINGTYELPGGTFGENGCCYQLLTDVTVTGTVYTDSECIEEFSTTEFTLQLFAGRFTTPSEFGPACQWAIAAALRGALIDELRVFQGDPQTSFSTPFSNAATCGPGVIFQHPCNVRESEGTVGQSGTATLSL